MPKAFPPEFRRDVVAVARNRVAGTSRTMIEVPEPLAGATVPPAVLRPMGEVLTRYHVALDVADRPGVLATVSAAFAEQGVSISTVRQEGRGEEATLVLVTHVAPERALAATVEQMGRLAMVNRVVGVLRVEGTP